MPARTVRLVTLGCARNEVDSEELAGRLSAAGWTLAGDGDTTGVDLTVVNTCGFIEAAKKDSIDTILAAADGGAPVVAVGCLAQRYGRDLAAALPEATVLSFDDYPDIAGRLDDVLHGRPLAPHAPTDRRTLLPLTPVARHGATTRDVDVGIPGHAGGPRPVRRRLDGGPVAPLKLASGCDRRCSFCAIPSFRGAFLSRPPADVLAEAAWLAGQGARELLLVSENSTSYGKDLGDLRSLEALLPRLAGTAGIERVRVSYLQPAEMRPSLVDVMTSTPGVVPYFDLSFQHASGPVLRRMRRFGDAERFLDLLATIRARAPLAGVRSNVIVGFPGETEADVAVLEAFLEAAGLDAVGVFGYSDEEGTEAAGLAGKLGADEIRARVEQVARLVDELTAQRAEQRLGETVEVLIDSVTDDVATGWAAHQGPGVDGETAVRGAPGAARGDVVAAVVTGSDGVDLQALDLRAESAAALVGASDG